MNPGQWMNSFGTGSYYNMLGGSNNLDMSPPTPQMPMLTSSPFSQYSLPYSNTNNNNNNNCYNGNYKPFQNNFMYFNPRPQPPPMPMNHQLMLMTQQCGPQRSAMPISMMCGVGDTDNGSSSWYNNSLQKLMMDDEMYFGRASGGGGGGGGGCIEGDCLGGGGGGCEAGWLPDDSQQQQRQQQQSLSPPPPPDSWANFDPNTALRPPGAPQATPWQGGAYGDRQLLPDI